MPFWESVFGTDNFFLHRYYCVNETQKERAEWGFSVNSWCCGDWSEHQTSSDRGSCSWSTVATRSTRIYFRIHLVSNTWGHFLGQSSCRRRVSWPFTELRSLWYYNFFLSTMTELAVSCISTLQHNDRSIIQKSTEVFWSGHRLEQWWKSVRILPLDQSRRGKQLSELLQVRVSATSNIPCGSHSGRKPTMDYPFLRISKPYFQLFAGSQKTMFHQRNKAEVPFRINCTAQTKFVSCEYFCFLEDHQPGTLLGSVI